MGRSKLATQRKKIKDDLDSLHRYPAYSKFPRTPNALTIKTIEDARKGMGIGPSIKNIQNYLNAIK